MKKFCSDSQRRKWKLDKKSLVAAAEKRDISLFIRSTRSILINKKKTGGKVGIKWIGVSVMASAEINGLNKIPKLKTNTTSFFLNFAVHKQMIAVNSFAFSSCLLVCYWIAYLCIDIDKIVWVNAMDRMYLTTKAMKTNLLEPVNWWHWISWCFTFQCNGAAFPCWHFAILRHSSQRWWNLNSHQQQV